MKKILILLIISACAAAAVAQDDEWIMPKAEDNPKLPTAGRSIMDFIPAGFEVVGKATGDLNADGLADAAVHIKGTSKKFMNKNEGLGSDVFDTNPRILVILFKDAGSGEFKLAEQSNTFIIAPDSPVSSEPFQEISIKNNVLNIEFELWQSAGGWGMTRAMYRFRYRSGEFQLIGADSTEAMRNSGEMETRSYNFLTNRVRVSTGNFSSDKNRKVRWRNLRKAPLKTFKTFPRPFEWEVERDSFI